MDRNGIKQPTLYLRSAYFIDSLRVTTGQGFLKLEKRIRQNQYEALGLAAPELETVRDYFRLHRSVAFEPRNSNGATLASDAKAPWLLAAELEVPGSSFAFFHPTFDLLFGQMESSVFWSAHFSKIPQAWIDEAKSRGDMALADEWETMNGALKKRLHRSRQSFEMDALSFIHLTMLRLPGPISVALFERKGLATTWARRYRPPQDEVEYLLAVGGLDAVAALFALTKEAGEIGDMERFHLAKAATIQGMALLDRDPTCRRIRRLVRILLSDELENKMFIRRYSRTLHHGFGLPLSWRAQLTPPLISRSMQELDLSESVR